jgi:hypothetical protein
MSIYVLLMRNLPSGSLTVAAELYSSAIRNSALGSNYVIAIIRGSSSP